MADAKALIDGLNEDLVEGEIPDEFGHAAYLADRIPVTKENQEMLENTLQAEMDTIERYTKRVAQAEAASEIALKVQLENMILDETSHRDDIRRMLVGWR